MSTQKILTINPEAFKFPTKRQTLKNKKVKPVQNANQALKSNKLKKELLKKVKDYQKNKEVEKLNDTKVLESQAPNLFDSNTLENSDFEREFNKSLTFLHDLAKKNKEKKKKKTLKVSNLDVHIDIPNDNLIYQSNKEPSYGCLKNGAKPTFRDLVKTKKNNDPHNKDNKDRLRIVLENNKYYDHAAFHDKYANVETPSIVVEQVVQQPLPLKTIKVIPNPIIHATHESKESKESNFINIFDNKNKMLNAMDNVLTNPKTGNEKCITYEFNSDSTNVGAPNVGAPNVGAPNVGAPNVDAPNVDAPNVDAPNVDATHELNNNNNNNNVSVMKYNDVNPIPKLCITTKTYKYKLGKNKERGQIGVLIKNRDTQKRIKKEIEQLKQQDIQSIKNYLREKGLIKLGSQAPNSILRKMYEDSILSGEINNNNNTNLVFNYLNT